MGYIYKVTNTVNGKVYIGQTSRDVHTRWCEHLHDTASKKDLSRFVFHRAIHKYGADSFRVETIEECDVADLDERERYWIKYYNSYEKGYNSDFGGRSNKGHPVYQYARDGTFLRGFDTLGQACNSVGAKVIILDSKHPNATNFGYYWRRYKVDKLDVAYSPKKRQVHQYSIDGEYISTYQSLSEAARTVNGRKTGTFIGAVCRGERDTAYGYRWSFEKVDTLPPFTPFKKDRKVVRISRDGKHTKVYDSIKQASEDNHIPGPDIIDVCKGRGFTSCGYYWKYYEEYEELIKKGETYHA